MSWRFWLGSAVAAAVAGGLCLFSLRLGGFALIVVALGMVATYAYRLL